MVGSAMIVLGGEQVDDPAIHVRVSADLHGLDEQ